MDCSPDILHLSEVVRRNETHRRTETLRLYHGGAKKSMATDFPRPSAPIALFRWRQRSESQAGPNFAGRAHHKRISSWFKRMSALGSRSDHCISGPRAVEPETPPIMTSEPHSPTKRSHSVCANCTLSWWFTTNTLGRFDRSPRDTREILYGIELLDRDVA
jgi:hypothetical protein